jgi:hypothetical protein
MCQQQEQQQKNSNTTALATQNTPVVVLRTCGAKGSRNKRCRNIKKWQTSTPKKHHHQQQKVLVHD